MVSEKPESGAEEEAGDDQDPDRCVGLAGDLARHEGIVGSDPGCNGVGDVVGTMSDGHHHGGGDLCVRPEMLDLVIVDGGMRVDGMEKSCIEGDAVFGNPAEEDVLDPGESTSRMVDRLPIGGAQEFLAGFHESRRTQ